MFLKMPSFLMMHYRVKVFLLLGLFSTLFALVGYINDGDATIFLVGDSTMADKPYLDGNPEKGWGQVFPLYFNEGIKIENHAVNGRSTKSFRDEGRWDVVLGGIKPGDYVIIEFGHNDEKSNDSTRYAAPETDYRKNLIRFVDESRAKGAVPILATPIVRRRFDENGQFFDTHGLYPQVVREVASQKSVPLLDLHVSTEKVLRDFGPERSKCLFLHFEPGDFPSLPEGKIDDTHLSGIGAFKVCDLVVNELKAKVPELAKFLKE